MSTFAVKDVYDIKNPAYVVKQRRKGAKPEEGGCIVAWNEEFERLTNFEPLDIDNMFCDKIFEGAQHLGGNTYKRICDPLCEYRTNAKVDTTVVVREFWINSKHAKGSTYGYIKRRADVFIFPFIENSRVYSLHILVDRGGVHTYRYFEETFMKRTLTEIEESLRKKIEISKKCCLEQKLEKEVEKEILNL